jgi:hypothetical protein
MLTKRWSSLFKISSLIISISIGFERDWMFVSIDPPGCKDIDDALHCIKLPNGNF